MPDDPRTSARIELLQGMSVFGGVGAEALAILLEHATALEVPKGSPFFHEGDAGSSAIVLEEGEVHVVKTWKGEQYFLRTLRAGDCFGEVALLDFFPRSATVMAAADCRAIEFHASDLMAVARDDLEPFSLIYMNLARELARRLREANELLFQARVKYQDVAVNYAFRTT